MAHIIGARGERAGKIIFDPIVWNQGLDGAFKHLPDLGDFIDCKTTPHAEPWLKIAKGRLNTERAYVLISSADHPYYWIAGWMWGHEIAQRGKILFPARPAYVVEASMLHKPHLLQQIVRDARPFD